MKRLYGPRAFYRLLTDMLINIWDMREARKTHRVSREFSERIMMAVTEVNGCRYWPYFHTHVAIQAGMIGGVELMYICGDFKGVPLEERAALYFAQYYAETGGKPKLETVQRMHETYGEVITRDILAYIRAIMIRNAWGNMFDALRLRMKGKPDTETTLWEELAVVFGIIGMMPAVFIQQVIRELAGEEKTAQYNK